MKLKKLKSYYIIRLEKGEEIVSALRKFAKKNIIKDVFFFGLSVANNLTLGCFDAQKKSYLNLKLTK